MARFLVRVVLADGVEMLSPVHGRAAKDVVGPISFQRTLTILDSGLRPGARTSRPLLLFGPERGRSRPGGWRAGDESPPSLRLRLRLRLRLLFGLVRGRLVSSSLFFGPER